MRASLLFWVAVAAGFYPYAIYPLIAWLASLVTRRKVARASIAPPVSVVISAYNEAAEIEATVRNKLLGTYAGPIEVLVASDGCSDATDEIVSRISAEDPRVRLLRQVPRQGKTAAINRLVAMASGEIIVFSDANSMYAPDTISRLVDNFADPTVGYVTGKMVYVNPQGTLIGDGCTAYMRYENWLRAIETKLGSIVGVDGGVDAVRRSLFRPMRPDLLPDFVLPLDVISQGARVIYEPRALLEERALGDEATEFRMRVRVALRAFWALRGEGTMLAGGAGALFAWQLWSHKLLRYLSFAPLSAATLLAAAMAARGAWVSAPVVLVSLALLAAALGAFGIKWSVSRYAYYFVLLNIASAVAVRRFLRGEKIAVWQPRAG